MNDESVYSPQLESKAGKTRASRRRREEQIPSRAIRPKPQLCCPHVCMLYMLSYPNIIPEDSSAATFSLYLSLSLSIHIYIYVYIKQLKGIQRNFYVCQQLFLDMTPYHDMMSSISRSNNYEVTTELTWENGQLAVHGLGGILSPQTKQTWSSTTKPGGTLESIVHQAATFNNFPQNASRGDINQEKYISSSGGKWGENSMEQNDRHQDHGNNMISSGGKWMGENSSGHMHMEQDRQEEGSLSSSMAAASSGGGKWREICSHMQVEQTSSMAMATIPISPGGKWGNQNEQNGGGGVRVKVKVNSMAGTTAIASDGKWRENLGQLQMDEEKLGVKYLSSKWGENYSGAETGARAGLVNKRVRSESEQYYCERASAERSACGSASATFCRDRDRDTTMMTWASNESPRSFKTPRNTDDDSACHACSENQDGERTTIGESSRSQSSARRSRAAAVHNQSERRRRDRINEKMKALQKLVPNASKTDKASMLDEVIEYLKQLQAQVQMMSSARNINVPQMVMPLGMQQQLQLSVLARMGMGMGMNMGMGMGMGMGMLDVNNLARNVPHSLPPGLVHAAASTAPSFLSPPPFTIPPVVAPYTTPLMKPNVDAATTINNSVTNFNDAFNTFLAQQSMNMDFLNKMAALYRMQANQSSKKPVTLSQANDGTSQGE